MCVSSHSNVIFPCKICNNNIKDTDVQPNVTFVNFGFK